MSSERSLEPIVYLKELPDRMEFGPFGNPYLVCPKCDSGALMGVEDPKGYGSMLICRRGCGQRYWIDSKSDPETANRD